VFELTIARLSVRPASVEHETLIPVRSVFGRGRSFIPAGHAAESPVRTPQDFENHRMRAEHLAWKLPTGDNHTVS
jgi:hypothetical protein